MIKLKQAIIVEGKYDKVKLSSFIDTIIIQTDGFKIFKDREKRDLIKLLAERQGIIILTDSDSAGFKIRKFISQSIPKNNIIQVYIPDLFGKEKRKRSYSKEGKLGVEGIEKNIIIEALKKSGVFYENIYKNKTDKITKSDLFIDGLTGVSNSYNKRLKLLKYLNLPEKMTTNSLLDLLNIMFTKEEYKKLILDLYTDEIDK